MMMMEAVSHSMSFRLVAVLLVVTRLSPVAEGTTQLVGGAINRFSNDVSNLNPFKSTSSSLPRIPLPSLPNPFKKKSNSKPSYKKKPSYKPNKPSYKPNKSVFSFFQ